MKRTWKLQIPGLVLTALYAAACGSAGRVPSTEVALGETAVIVSVNPTVNDQSDAVTTPGEARVGVPVSLDRQRTATDASGLAILTKLEAGLFPLQVGEGSIESFRVEGGELREVAVATQGASAEIMANIDYSLGRLQVFELRPDHSAADVYEALEQSHRLIKVVGGVYEGDLIINGSNITLFGEGGADGAVTIRGDIIINGSNNRIRGTTIEGDLSVNGSSFGMSFSHVLGSVNVSGSSSVLMENVLCRGATFDGSWIVAVGNLGLPPLALPAGGC